jgi:iron complex transport system ATP-binding protein
VSSTDQSPAPHPAHAAADADAVGGRSVRLHAEHVRLGYGDRVVVDDLTVALPTGKITVIVGANACGKSTLLRAFARLLTPRTGTILLDGVAIQHRNTREVASTLGILPQQPIAPDGISVHDLVARGRHPHQRWFRQWSQGDADAVRWALDATDMTGLAQRNVDELSGGQRQRAWIAMAIAQGTPILLLDEPTTFLDLAHQMEVLDLLAQLNRDENTTLAIVLHDLNQACRYADHLIAMKDGQVVAEGPPAAIVDEALVRDVFGLDALVVADPVTGTPLVVPIPRTHR